MKRLLLALPLLAACVGGPLGDAPPLGAAKIEEDAVVGAARLALSEWAPEGPPRAVLLAVHGYGDYGPSAFAEAAAYWAERGILTYAYDQRGFGRNESRGRWPGAETLIADFTEIATRLHARRPGLPFYVLGESMGGAVALAGVAEGAPADGLILSAPAAEGGAALPLPWRAAAWAGALTLPEKRWTGEGIVRIQASDDIDMLRRLAADPLYIGQPSSREFMGLIRLMDRAVAGAPSMRAPALVLLGDRDEVVSQSAVVDLAASLGGPHRLIRYKEGWHLLMRDLQKRRVWQDVADWIERPA